MFVAPLRAQSLVAQRRPELGYEGDCSSWLGVCTVFRSQIMSQAKDVDHSALVGRGKGESILGLLSINDGTVPPSRCRRRSRRPEPVAVPEMVDESVVCACA
jgi:hypothetical protein